ncbi:MAG TPA: DUF932 domain-containing protein [Phycisphaerae bacterium]|nr:DUF932 domain-containing protein [Phycisphaerae bacterium]
MPRLTQLDEVLFPVEEHPVLVSFRSRSGERQLPVPEKKALVNSNNGRVLGIVSRDYRLVSNREALDYACACCRTAFPETEPVEWKVEVTDAPATGGHCYIDLAHNSTALDVTFVPAHDRPDAFGPFIRVTNSYNSQRALAFDIGFFRKVCRNGLVVRELSIRFKFLHTRRDIGAGIRFEIDQNQLTRFRTGFRDHLAALRGCAVPRKSFEPFVCGVLLIRSPSSLRPESREAEDWAALSAYIGGLCNRYAETLGENAYAVMNAVTDFASRPPQNRCVHRDRHTLQCLAGTWLGNFSAECRKRGFILSDYVKRLATATTASAVGRRARANENN